MADKPTATLERRFCEHIDTCSYRLDAWQTAIFDQRLRKQRGLKDGGEQTDRKKGIYLGAFGWVEDLRPGNKQQMAGDTLPEALRPPDQKPYFEYEYNGGFVHAPSINQATAAAVLRSGYLSHATSANPDVMAVNLSSERVRRALFIIEGLRNGQTLEALLGFQFERGLHDRGSADDNLKKLNEYVYNFRDTFTIKQHVVPQQGMPTTTTETIERNNIVNGLTLAETTAPFPYGVTLDAAGMNEPFRSAIIAEKDKLEDTLDAVKDLFLSESVFQMTQGNFDRAAAVTAALRDASVPPEIEVINTPATNHLSFTNRVTIQFNAAASFAGANPRARMEPGMNEWLRRVIGDPAELICLVSHEDETLEISMADCNLQPIDLLYLAGAESELESRIGYTYRRKQGLSDDVTVNIQFIGLGTTLLLVKKLKQVITDSRPLHAQDFGSGAQGQIVQELKQRVEDARAVFGGLLSDLSGADIETALINISGFGLPDSFPNNDLAGQASSVANTMTTILQKVDELLQNITLDTLIKAGKLLFGESFNILPHFSYHNATDIQQSNDDRDQLLKHATGIANMQFPADEWMQKCSPVRPKLARWDEVRTIYELYHDDQLTIAPIQVPYLKNDSWVAVDFPEDFNIIHDTLSIVIHGEPAFATNKPQCGILIDEWTEVVPGKEALTGITFNYDQPGAMPPQALLLAVSPIESGSWSWDSLVGILNDTLLRAKLRAVEPQLLDTLQRPDTGVMLPAVLSTFSQFGLDISLDYRLNVEFYEKNLPLTSI